MVDYTLQRKEQAIKIGRSRIIGPRKAFVETNSSPQNPRGPEPLLAHAKEVALEVKTLDYRFMRTDFAM